MKTVIITMAAVAAILLSPAGLRAEDATGNAPPQNTPAASIDDRLHQLESEIALLKRQQEVDKEVAQAAAEKAATVELGKTGLQVASPDRNLTLSLRGYAQIDDRVFVHDSQGNGTDGILARRIRPVIEGTAFKDVSFRIMPDFGGSTVRLYDAWIEYRVADPLTIRVGKFKPPVGLERLQSATDLFFVERGLPTNLVPNRDYGLQASGSFFSGIAEYQVGVFDGTQDLGNADGDSDDRKDVAGRIFVQPFRRSDLLALQGLGAGIAGSIGDHLGSPTRKNTILQLPGYVSPGQSTFFKYLTGSATDDDATFAAKNVYASGRQWRLVPQGYWFYNNFGLLGEYAISTQLVQKAATTANLRQRAWQAVASWSITGEDVNYKGNVTPAKPFRMSGEGWGAFELVARIGRIAIDGDAFPTFADITASARSAKSAGLGLNWYLNNNLSVWLDYDYTQFSGGTKTGDRPDEQALFTRFQVKL